MAATTSLTTREEEVCTTDVAAMTAMDPAVAAIVIPSRTHLSTPGKREAVVALTAPAAAEVALTAPAVVVAASMAPAVAEVATTASVAEATAAACADPVAATTTSAVTSTANATLVAMVVLATTLLEAVAVAQLLTITTDRVTSTLPTARGACVVAETTIKTCRASAEEASTAALLAMAGTGTDHRERIVVIIEEKTSVASPPKFSRGSTCVESVVVAI
mmetsp:Transcript_18204/g.22715  ORF Transcript_18204/g.22715 Transcript_18204/m.22715 type:complete len:219 (+) Transcript_18204:316-972(+)